MKSLQFKKGEIFAADDSSTAYKIREGSMDIFLVPYKAETAGRRILIHEAGTGETVPGFDFTDYEHVHWVFHFRALEELELIATEGGVTRVLKQKFASRADLKNFAEEGFEYSVIERYNKQKIKEDLNIRQKEEETGRAAQEKKQVLEQMTGAGPVRKGQKARSAAAEPAKGGLARLSDSIRTVTRFARVQADKKGKRQVSLLSLAAALTGAMLFFLPPRAAVVSAMMLFILLIGLKNRQADQAAIEAGVQMQQQAFRNLFALDEDTYRKVGKTELAALCMGSFDMVKEIILSAFSLYSGLVICAAMFAGVIIKKFETGIPFLLIAMACGALIILCANLAEQYGAEASQGRKRANARLYHYLKNINKIKVSGSEENILRDYFILRADKAAERLRAAHVLGVSDAVQTIMIIAVIPVTVLSWKFPSLVLPLTVLGGCWIQTMLHLAQMPRLGRQTDMLRIVLKEKAKETRISIEEITSIELEDVWFSYGYKDVIKGMSMEIRKGETIGLIGESGSGKSTLLKLMTGIEQPKKGHITINGHPIEEIDILTFREKIGIVTQEEALIAASLIDNIRMGSDASAEDVFDAIVKTGLAGFVSSLPMGVDTILSEEGGSVSCGQKQKILIARALVRKPDLLILDEAMSEMDNESIEEICYALEELDAAKIMISHRIEPLKNCDRIVVTE